MTITQVAVCSRCSRAPCNCDVRAARTRPFSRFSLSLRRDNKRKQHYLLCHITPIEININIMGKKKKVPEKLRQYYKGTVTPPTRVANEQDMAIIRTAFEECLPNRSTCTFKNLKFVVGLKAGLRCLKQKRTKAIIYDNTAGNHLTRYLNLFGNKQNIPVVEANRLIDLAPLVKLRTVLVVSLVDNAIEENTYREKDPRPKLIAEEVQSRAFEQLHKFLFDATDSSRERQISFKMPELEQVPSSGKSKAKKEAKKLKNKRKEVPRVSNKG